MVRVKVGLIGGMLTIVAAVALLWFFYGVYYWDDHFVQPKLIRKYLPRVRACVHPGDTIKAVERKLDNCGLSWQGDPEVLGTIWVDFIEIDGRNVSEQEAGDWENKHPNETHHLEDQLGGREEEIQVTISFLNGRVSDLKGQVMRFRGSA